MKRLIPISLLAVISLVVPQQAQSAAKAKSGAKCTVVKSTEVVNGKKFTCIKSGSKLIWNKGVTITKPATSTPSPTPSATLSPRVQAKPNPFDFTPFPDEFTRAEMVEAIFRSFDEFIKRTPNVNSYKLVIDPGFQSDSAAITKLVKDVYAVLPFPAGYPTTVAIMSDDRDLIEKSVKENGFGKEGFQQSGYYCRNCAGYGWATSSKPLSSVTPHEIFHVWQKAAYGRDSDNNTDPSNPLNSPVWFDEGGADFFAFAIYSKFENSYPGSRVGSNRIRLIDASTRNIDSGLPYSLGRLAGEYIVASKGIDKFLEIYLNVGKGQDFPTAFNNALGITLERFYEKFDKNIEKLL
jgi:hypothetical protein